MNEKTYWKGPLDGESVEAYSAFCAYRDLGHHCKRSIKNAFLKKKEVEGKPLTEWQKANRNAPTRWNIWSSKFHWPSRAQAYDCYIDQELLKAKLKQAKEKLEQIEVWQWEDANRLRKKANEMLDFSLTVTEESDGKTIIYPAKWTLRDAVTMLVEANKLANESVAFLSPGKEAQAVQTLVQLGIFPPELLDISVVEFQGFSDRLRRAVSSLVKGEDETKYVDIDVDAYLE